jgi:class 3 adenylate cyclase
LHEGGRQSAAAIITSEAPRDRYPLPCPSTPRKPTRAQKFTYDVWGDAVNLASRLETAGEPGRIHVSGATREKLAATFEFACRGDLLLKGIGIQRTWYLLGEMDAGSPSSGAAA